MNQITAMTSVISSAWTDTLSEFVQSTREELLLMSPWITTTVANLISHNITKDYEIRLQILSRLDEVDFLRGSSHINAFKTSMYPSNTLLEIRALPMLHGKMLISDRKRLIVGSANMTEGGLHKNHEVSLLIDSPVLSNECVEVFYKYWNMATILPNDYLDQMESTVTSALPKSEDVTEQSLLRKDDTFSAPTRKTTRFKYVRPQGASVAHQVLTQLLQKEPIPDVTSEDTPKALFWLSQELRFLSKEERRSSETVRHIEQLMCHPDIDVRAMAIDRAGRSENLAFFDSLISFVANPDEDSRIRSAAAFALGLLGSPEALHGLHSLILDENKNLRRWARRGCFLLISSVDQEEVAWILNELEVDDPTTVWQLANRCSMGIGTVSERLTKALVIEKLATNEWTEFNVNALVFLMFHISKALKAKKKIPHFGLVNKTSAIALSVEQGDLRHGPFSPKLLTNTSLSGFEDPGLEVLLGSIWRKTQKEDSSFAAEILNDPKIGSVFQFLE